MCVCVCVCVCVRVCVCVCVNYLYCMYIINIFALLCLLNALNHVFGICCYIMFTF